MPGPSSVADSTAHRLSQLISAGELGVGGRLPGERELAQHLHVSRTTLRRALSSLAADGLIAATAKSGWFLAEAPLSEPPRTLISFTEMARRRGITPHTHVLNCIVRESTIDEAQQLNTVPLSPVLDLERLRSFADTPICTDHAVILLQRCAGLDQAELEDASLYEQMAALGVHPSRSNFVVEAIGASERDAELLQVAVGSPILLGEETCFDAIGNPLLIGCTKYRPNVYRFYSTMVRR